MPNGKVEAVLGFPTLLSPKDVKSFLGLATFYRPFIRNFANIAKPLTELLKKDVEWSWKNKEIKAFEDLKRTLTSAPVLRYPDFSKPFVLVADASGFGIGAALMQYETEGNGKLYPIGFASRALNKAKINYIAFDRELLAICWALRHFREILYGYPITVYTDHRPLTYGLSCTDTMNARRIRHTLVLQDYQANLVYLPGKLNVVADALSRNIKDQVFDKDIKTIKVANPKDLLIDKVI